MDHQLQHIGRIGENCAAEYLINQGFSICVRNFHFRRNEIDLIVQKNNKIVFCEVKTRLGNIKGEPYEAVDRRKLAHLHLAAQYYLLQNPSPQAKLSIYVIAVLLNADYSLKQLRCFEDVDLDY